MVIDGEIYKDRDRRWRSRISGFRGLNSNRSGDYDFINPDPNHWVKKSSQIRTVGCGKRIMIWLFTDRFRIGVSLEYQQHLGILVRIPNKQFFHRIFRRPIRDLENPWNPISQSRYDTDNNGSPGSNWFFILFREQGFLYEIMMIWIDFQKGFEALMRIHFNQRNHGFLEGVSKDSGFFWKLDWFSILDFKICGSTKSNCLINSLLENGILQALQCYKKTKGSDTSSTTINSSYENFVSLGQNHLYDHIVSGPNDSSSEVFQSLSLPKRKNVSRRFGDERHRESCGDESKDSQS